jgi:hypothetical protein
VTEAPTRPSQSIPVISSIAPDPAPAPKPSEPKTSEPKTGETKELQLGVTQVFERMAKMPTPTPAPAVVSKTPSPSVEAVEPRKPRIGFGKDSEGSKKMLVIAGGAIAAVLVIGAIVVVPRMGHSAPAPATTTVAAAPAANKVAAPAAVPVAESQTQAAAPTSPAPTSAAEPAQASPSQSREGFAEHMGPAATPAAPAPATEEPDSSVEHARPTPKTGTIKLSKTQQPPPPPDVTLPSAPSLNLDAATKAIDSTTKTNKKKKADSIAVPSF